MPKILLVEDNEMNRDMLSRRLGRSGYEVMLAVDGLEGILLANTQSPDLIVMDLDLPELDGWQATRILKSTPVIKDIPILVLTAHAMMTDRERAIEAGCDDFASKPVEFKRLLSKINGLLSRKKAKVL